jgi:hypothetical protein
MRKPIEISQDSTNELRGRAEECYRLAKEARDKWIAKALVDLGDRLHARAERLENENNGPPG